MSTQQPDRPARKCESCGNHFPPSDFPSYMVADPDWPDDKPLPCCACLALIQDDPERKTHTTIPH